MSVKTIEVEGPTVLDATKLGLAALGLDGAEAVVEVLSPPANRPGTVRVRVTERGGEVSQETVSPTSTGERPEFPGKQVVLDTFELILSKFGLSARVAIKESAESFEMSVTGDGAEILIGRQGQTIEAIEYLMNRIAGGVSYDSPRVAVDVDGYRERREAALLELAATTSAAVRDTRRPVVLQPMSPRDRRIVHLALQGDPSVRTHSEGDGTFRTLVVSPSGTAQH